MDIREALVAEHSKYQAMRIVRYNDANAVRLLGNGFPQRSWWFSLWNGKTVNS